MRAIDIDLSTHWSIEIAWGWCWSWWGFRSDFYVDGTHSVFFKKYFAPKQLWTHLSLGFIWFEITLLKSKGADA